MCGSPPPIRIPAGGATTITLYPNDLSYTFPSWSEACETPCKLIRVSSPGLGTLSITLTAHDPAGRLAVFTDEGSRGYCCNAQQTIRVEYTTDETVIYVKFEPSEGLVTDHRIAISTSFEPR